MVAAGQRQRTSRALSQRARALRQHGSMVSAAAKSTTAAALVFVISVVLITPDAPLWCVLIALGAAAWRILVAIGYLAPLKPFVGMRFLLGAITAALVVAVAVSFRTLNGLAAGTALLL